MDNGVDYTNMSLDDVIRHMRARELSKSNPTANGISPFFRQEPPKPSSSYQSTFPRKTRTVPFRYRSYTQYLANKRLQQSRRIIDLRRRLIHLRTTRQGVDLRVKLLALFIADLRAKQNICKQRRRWNTRPNMRYFPSNSSALSPGVWQPKIDRSTASKIERLVGKLPPWLASDAPRPCMGTVMHHQNPSNQYGYSSYNNENDEELYLSPPSIHSNSIYRDPCPYPARFSGIHSPVTFPALTPAPPLPSARAARNSLYSVPTALTSSSDYESIGRAASVPDHIQVILSNDYINPMEPPKITLNERFSH